MFEGGRDIGQREEFLHNKHLAQPGDLLKLIPNMGSAYPFFKCSPVMESSVYNSFSSCISRSKLIGTMEFKWVPTTPGLRISCIRDPSKTGDLQCFSDGS